MIWLWIKKQILFFVITSTSTGIFFSFTLIAIYIQNIVPINQEMKMYVTSEFDYILTDASYNQIYSLNKRVDVDDTSSVYIFDDIQFSFDKSSALFFESREKMEHTFFNSHRVISQSSESYQNPIFITYEISRKYDLKIGDSIFMIFGKSNEIFEFNLERIYENNYFLTNQYGIGILWSHELEESLGNSELFYNLTFVETNNKTFDTYVGEYIPFAKAPSRDDYTTQELYDNALELYLSRDFSNSVINKNLLIENHTVRYDSRISNYKELHLLINISFIAVSIFVFGIIHFFNKDKYLSIILLGAKKRFILTIKTLEMIIYLAITSLITFTSVYIWQNTSHVYVDSKYLVNISYWIIVNIFISYIYIRFILMLNIKRER
jgi:hypothetical protein